MIGELSRKSRNGSKVEALRAAGCQGLKKTKSLAIWSLCCLLSM